MEGIAPALFVLASIASALGLIGAWLVTGTRAGMGALLMLEAVAGLAVGIGEYGLIPGALLLGGALLAWLGRASPRRRPRR